MKRVAVLVGLLAAPTYGQFLRGVNLAGAEFGEKVLPGTPGTHYTWNSEASFAYFASKGLNLFRIPFRWERLQPVPRGPLDAAYLAGLKQNVAWANKNGVRVVIEPHNFGRYVLDGREHILDNGVISTLDLIDLWERISDEFRDELAVYAYDLMNEPHQMGSGNWKLTSQTVLSALRNRGDTKRIMIPGDDWSSANRWVRNHGTQGWIVDPADNFAYEAHQYFDRDESGGYTKPLWYNGTSYEYQASQIANLPEIGVKRVSGFLEWCRNNGVKGYLGEYGVPNDDPRWMSVLDRFMVALDEAKMDATYWAAGEWWNDYKLSVQPRNGEDRVQLSWLQAHSGAAVMTTVSAAAGAIASVAPDSLASGYGFNLFEGADVRVDVKDATGAILPAEVFYASPLQINFLVPAGLTTGIGEVTVRSPGRVSAIGAVRIENEAPALFNFAEFVADGQQIYMVLYGTGLRRGSGATLRVGDYVLIPEYAGPQLQYAGLDQVNVLIPEPLVGAGEVPVMLNVAGKNSNELRVTIRRPLPPAQ
ncbi:MAG TPA: cellulase family glycosylhydrolase [Bryobacteraceae bacterium]|nr:cellulase family glycosylhydrolase [Bryobacteraceae bacterium]